MATHDTYVFSGNFGNDTIKDFQKSSDAVQLDHNVFENFVDVVSHARAAEMAKRVPTLAQAAWSFAVKAGA